MSVEIAGLMAGGLGTRLASSGISGAKPFIHVAGRPLVDYFLTEAHAVGVKHIVAAVRADDYTTPERLAADLRFQWRFVETDGSGTLGAVVALTEAIGQQEHIISTCDVVMPPGTLRRLIDCVDSQPKPKPLMVLLVSDSVQDSTPIWVHLKDSDSGIVNQVGKDIDPSPLVFASVRWCSAAWAAEVVRRPAGGLTRDTQYLAHLVEDAPGSVIAFLEPDVMDVDNAADLKAVTALVEASPSWNH